MKTNLITRTFAALALAATVGFGAQAATVTFSDMSSGDGSALLFDPATSVAAGNTLNIGLNSFEATSAGVLPGLAVDSFGVKITAPAGFYISSIDFGEIYNYASATGAVGITLSASANGGLAAPAGAAFFNSTGANVGIGIPQMLFAPGTDIVDFSISNSLFAIGIGGPVSIGKDSATLTVGLTAVPLPPAIGLLGAALIGIATVRPRRAQA